MKNIQLQTQEYKDFIAHIKSKIQNAQIKASIKVNEELLKLYLEMASLIVEKQKLSSWGDNFLEKFSRDLQKEFPNMKGFSYRNLRAIKQWYLFWQQAVANLENKDWQQIVAIIVSIPWGHNLAILSKCKDINEALFYVELTIENNYSRAILLREIEKNLYKRKAKAITNFERKLPKPHSQLAIETLKNPYNFDFLDLRNSHDERELEDAFMI